VLAGFGFSALTTNAQTIAVSPKDDGNYTIIISKFKEGDKPNKWENGKGFGWHMGGYLNYNFSDALAFQPEVLLSQRRIQTVKKFETAVGNVVTENAITTNAVITFIEIPLLLAIGNPSEGLQFHIGPSVTIFSSSKAKVTDRSTIKDVPTETSVTYEGSDAEEDQRTIDFSFCGEFLCTMQSGFNVGLLYQRGPTSINDENTDVYTSNYNMIQLSFRLYARTLNQSSRPIAKGALMGAPFAFIPSS